MNRFEQLPAGSQAIVMGTGIVSVALLFDGERTISRGLMWLALAIWVALSVAGAHQVLARPGRFRRHVGVSSLAGVAGTAVLGTRFVLYGSSWVGWALLAMAALLWVWLVPPAARRWRTPVPGSAFLIVVSTASLSVLADLLAATVPAGWLLIPGVGLLVVAAALYPVVAAAFGWRELLHGAGDHWIAGGAVAILALAVGELIATGDRLGELHSLHGVLVAAGWVLWVAAIAWLGVVIAGELAGPRLGSPLRRWATVFPLGMYAAMSFTLGSPLDAPAIIDFARACAWVALGSWALVFAATVRLGFSSTG